MGFCDIGGNNSNNYIIGAIVINEYSLNKEIPIISSYEAYQRSKGYYNYSKSCCNEEEITKCEIEIDGIKIPFSYSYKFNTIGKHIIKYSFKKNLINMDYMFYNCSSLTSLNFSCLNTKNVASMFNIFHKCSSLSFINLSNFNSKSLQNMKEIFGGSLST